MRSILDLRDELPIVGVSYLVPVHECVNLLNEYIMIPVIGTIHNDYDTNGLDIDHVHVDMRFITDAELISYGWKQEAVSLYNAPAIRIDNKVTEIKFEPRVCVSQQFKHHETWKTLGIEKVEAKLDGFVLPRNCRICPHKGTNLAGIKANADGFVKCPAHGLILKQEN
jgi:hypothetical protein